ncbi:MAG TPA: glycosyltransferase [Acidimicrobiales bacterium]|nr:glycosyltransferase [Acidimicrobiales bacterium]
MEAPAISVVVPAYRADATLSGCLDSVLSQRVDFVYEVIVVASADTPEGLPALAPDERLRVIERVPRVGCGPARAIGIEAARAELIAWIDADALAAPGWLSHLFAASEGRYCAAGAVTNGTPGSPWGTVQYLCEFLNFHPRRPARSAWQGVGCNLLVPRPLWDAAGPLPRGVSGEEADTWFTSGLAAKGLLRFAPGAQVSHLNRTRAKEVLGHLYRMGRYTNELAATHGHRYGVLASSPWLVPVAVVGRFLACYVRLAVWSPRELARAVPLAPLVALGLVAWGAGSARQGLARWGLSARRRAPASH